jgi:hypothetical protein
MIFLDINIFLHVPHCIKIVSKPSRAPSSSTTLQSSFFDPRPSPRATGHGQVTARGRVLSFHSRSPSLPRYPMLTTVIYEASSRKIV